VIPAAAVEAHSVDPAWSALYNTYKCKTCGKWAYQLHGGEWKHGGAK